MHPRQEPESTPIAEVIRWAAVLWRLLRWVEGRTERLDLMGWLLAHVHHVSRGDPRCERLALQGARYGLPGLRLDQHRQALSGSPEMGLGLLADQARLLTGGVYLPRYGPALLLALAVGRYAAQQWVLRTGDHPYIEEHARQIATLAPLAAQYSALVSSWLDVDGAVLATLLDLPEHHVTWRNWRGRTGQVLIPPWRGVVQMALHGRAVAFVPPGAEVFFEMAGQRRPAPGPSLKAAARALLLEAEELPVSGAVRLARALGLEVPDDATLAHIKARLEPTLCAGLV